MKKKGDNMTYELEHDDDDINLPRKYYDVREDFHIEEDLDDE